MTMLCMLAEKFGTDKGPTEHAYTQRYDFLFRNRLIKNVLEIGIYQGASLRMWEEYWPEAEILGLDNSPDTMIDEGHIHSLLCDQGSEESFQTLNFELGDRMFEVIIDDGSHQEDHQLLSVKMLLHRVTVGGLYIIEDIPIWNRLGVYAHVMENLPQGYSISMIETGMKAWDRMIVIERWW
jgi:hypothetical protein